MNLLWSSLGEMPGIDILLIQCYSGWRPQELGLLEIENIDLVEWTFKGGIKTDADTRVRFVDNKIFAPGWGKSWMTKGEFR